MIVNTVEAVTWLKLAARQPVEERWLLSSFRYWSRSMTAGIGAARSSATRSARQRPPSTFATHSSLPPQRSPKHKQLILFLLLFSSTTVHRLKKLTFSKARNAKTSSNNWNTAHFCTDTSIREQYNLTGSQWLKNVFTTKHWLDFWRRGGGIFQ